MSKFIKLTNLININYIESIFIKPNKYYIHVPSNKFDRSKWSVVRFGICTISSYNSKIEIYETQHSSYYKIVSDWINNHYFAF
jgi:hypothetical protein